MGLNRHPYCTGFGLKRQDDMVWRGGWCRSRLISLKCLLYSQLEGTRSSVGEAQQIGRILNSLRSNISSSEAHWNLHGSE
ncbi:hypothetical protein Tco_0577810 [Tanacetum coccineum]